MASGVYFSSGFFECWYLSVLHSAVVTFLCTQDNPNSFHSPLSPDLNKGVTVSHCTRFCRLLNHGGGEAGTGAGAGNLGSVQGRALHGTPNLTVRQLSIRELVSSRADLLPWGFGGFLNLLGIFS